MGKQGKILAACVALLAVLIALVIVAFQSPGEADTSSQENDSVIDLAFPGLTAVTVTNEKGTVKAVKQEDAFVIEGLEGLPISANLGSMTSQAAGLEATRKIDSSDLEQFGLQNPSITVTLQNAKESRTLKIGGEAPSAAGTYVLMENQVYLIDSNQLTAFEYGPLDYVSTQVTEPLTEEDVVESVFLTRDNTTVKLQYVPEQEVESVPSEDASSSNSSASSSEPETIPAYYKMTEPLSAEIASYNVVSWANDAFGFSADAAAVLHPIDTDLKAYGLEEPETVLQVTLSNGKSIRLTVSKPQDGICYLMRDDVPIIYRVTSGSVTWRTVSVQTLLGTVFPGVEPQQVKSLDINGQGKSYHLTAESEALKNVASTVLQVKPSFADDGAEPSLAPVLTVVISYQDTGKPSDTLEFVPTGYGKLYLVLNGASMYVSGESNVDTILEACEQPMQGDTSSSGASS